MDDVLIDAPAVVTKEMIQSLKISVVVTGPPSVRRQFISSDSDSDNDHASAQAVAAAAQVESSEDAYAVPREMGILTVLPATGATSGGGEIDSSNSFKTSCVCVFLIYLCMLFFFFVQFWASCNVFKINGNASLISKFNMPIA